MNLQARPKATNLKGRRTCIAGEYLRTNPPKTKGEKGHPNWDNYRIPDPPPTTALRKSDQQIRDLKGGTELRKRRETNILKEVKKLYGGFKDRVRLGFNMEEKEEENI
ncbi:hypothetical protein C922_05759 [Plasmodium inui San Antonio 1]|uniref:Uncharacterized protein n=1 Tax=Plasmodium inui San Antonio 1 TaxID=1237626 RepID=W7A443_9APIC|nr:hypothetical protein C922_05759 [Plasmodium inui San Antonio 1]EUD63859.1 hypothetical protein C922_05759 [Plasmodium inui San Antonio 1]